MDRSTSPHTADDWTEDGAPLLFSPFLRELAVLVHKIGPKLDVGEVESLWQGKGDLDRHNGIFLAERVPHLHVELGAVERGIALRRYVKTVENAQENLLAQVPELGVVDILVLGVVSQRRSIGDGATDAQSAHDILHEVHHGHGLLT